MTDEKIEEKVERVVLNYRVWLVSDGWESPTSILHLINATESGRVRWVRDFGERYIASWSMERGEGTEREGCQITVTMRCEADQPTDRAYITFGRLGIVDGPYELRGPGIDHLRGLVAHKVHDEAVVGLKQALARSPRGSGSVKDGESEKKLQREFLYRDTVTGDRFWSTSEVGPPHFVILASRGKDGVLRWE